MECAFAGGCGELILTVQISEGRSAISRLQPSDHPGRMACHLSGKPYPPRMHWRTHPEQGFITSTAPNKDCSITHIPPTVLLAAHAAQRHEARPGPTSAPHWCSKSAATLCIRSRLLHTPVCAAASRGHGPVPLCSLAGCCPLTRRCILVCDRDQIRWWTATSWTLRSRPRSRC